jgi:Xaa-Pro aminopeptidase
MDATGAAAYLIVGRADGSERGRIHYVSDLSVMGGITYVLLPRDAAPILFQPAFVGRAWAETAGWITDNRSAVDPIVVIADALGDLSLRGAQIGIVGLADVMPIRDFRWLAEHLPDAKLTDETAAFDRVRSVKSGEEIAGLQATSALLMEGYAALESVLAPGRTERDVVAEAIGAVRRGGGLGGFLHISRSGGVTALHPPTDDVIRDDDILTFDFEYTGRDHYALELTRQYSFGAPPPPAIAARFAAQSRVFERMRDVLRPGQTTAAIARLVHEAYEAEGYVAAGPEGWGPVQLHAHGIGLDFGEPPFIPGPDAVLAENMVLALHPNIGPEDPSVPVVSVADNVLVTPGGGERLTDTSIEWRIL